MRMRRNPATIAGLAGIAVASAPLPAFASPVEEIASGIFATPTTAFVAGAIGGAVVAGAVSGVVCHALLTSDARKAAAAQDAFILQRGDSAFEQEGLEEEPSYSGKHFRAVQPDSVQPAAVSVAPVAAEPVAAQAAVPVPVSDYEAIAQSYAEKNSSRRPKFGGHTHSVANKLRERFDADMMSDLPVIARPDGSVADVGTSWWNTSVGLASITSFDSYVEEDTMENLAIPSDFTAKTGRERLVEAAKSSSEFMQADISQRIAFVDEGEFPEVRSPEDSLADDVWASALKSMDERLNAQGTAAGQAISMPFCDIVGDMDTLDEPDGLEQNTTFIPFKTPAGHPEVVDTETYVDYLIGEEFGRNSSDATRNAAGRFLRLLEGGTSTSRLNTASRRSARDTDVLDRTREPKHFAEAPLAKEA